MAVEIGQLKITPCSGSGLAGGWTAGQVTYTFYPKALKIEAESVASNATGRTSTGDMYVSYLKSNLRKLSVTLPPYPITDDTYKNILHGVVGRVSVVEYYDIYTHASRKTKMYCSSADGEYYSGVNCGGIIQGAAFNLIEMDGTAL